MFDQTNWEQSHKDRFEILIVTVFSLLALFLLFLVLYFAKLIVYGQNSNEMPASITVSATGEAKVVPNLATFSFSVVETGKDVNEAQNKMAAKGNKVLEYLTSQRIGKKDIQTTNYSANPKYEYTPNQVQTGFEARESITVKVHDSEKAGAILGGISQLNVSEISGISFSSDDLDSLKQQALEDAIMKAKVKAHRLAEDLGVRLVRVSSFYEDMPDQGGPLPYAMMDSAKAVSTQAAVAPMIQVGENTVTASVSISYDIR